MKKIFLVLMLVFFSRESFSQTAAHASDPVEISAKKSLEWSRKDKTYTARENVIVKQGDIRMESDILTARYTDGKGASDIEKLEASGHIVIQSPPYTAYGDKAVYNVKTGIAALTGNNLKITTDQETLIAKDKVEFSSLENRLTAAGGVRMTRGTDDLTADVMTVQFNKGAGGKLSANKATVRGHVIIQTPKETVMGDEGVYDIPSQKAFLTGKVRILQGENWLEGRRAEVDMATGISQLLGGSGENDGRVKGVFYPKKEGSQN